uniref:immunoglobulin-like domain-containing protein n=1 Tax=Agathobacter sp. TaxID=2021311 RepID=UPI004056113B
MKKKKTHKLTIFLLLFIFIVVMAILLYAFEVPVFPSETETKETTAADTTPPVIKCSVRTLTLKKGESLSLDRLSLRITDKSKIGEPIISKVTSDHINLANTDETAAQILSRFAEGMEINDLSYAFPYGGIYDLTISVKDEWQNEGFYTITVTVEEPPILTAVSSFYIAKDSEVTFEEYAAVWDFLDETCDKEAITVDTSQLDIAVVGTYPITYTASDNYGLKATFSPTVYVNSPEEIQKLIDSHAISPEDSVIIGAPNPYDIGFYKEHDTEYNKQLLLPALVSIRTNSGTSEKGFILEITDDRVLLCTNSDSVDDTLTREVAFSNGITRKAVVTAIDSRRNLAFLQLPITKEESAASLTLENVKKLRTIHIDEAFWDEIHPYLFTLEVPLSDILNLYEELYGYRPEANR